MPSYSVVANDSPRRAGVANLSSLRVTATVQRAANPVTVLCITGCPVDGGKMAQRNEEVDLCSFPMRGSSDLPRSEGPRSAEAYVILELREARSAGDHVFAFQSNGRYTVRSTPN